MNPPQRALDRAVEREPDTALHARRRGHQHERTLVGAQGLEAGARAVVGAAQRDGRVLLPECQIDVLEPVRLARSIAGRVVHDGVQRAEALHREVDGMGDGRLVGDVAPDPRAATAPRVDLADDGMPVLVAACR